MSQLPCVCNFSAMKIAQKRMDTSGFDYIYIFYFIF